MASCGLWLFLLGSRFFLSDLSLGRNELHHRSQRPLLAETSTSATGSFRDRGDGDVGSDITEVQTPAQERRYRHCAKHLQLVSAPTFCLKTRVVGSRRLFSETVCVFHFHIVKHPVLCSGSFLVSLVSSFCSPHHKKSPPPPPAVPPSSSPARCLPPSLPSGRATCDFKKSSTPSSSWTITQKFTPAQNWLHNSAYCVQRWKHFQSDRPEPLEPLKKENCGGKKNNFGRRLSFFPCGSF